MILTRCLLLACCALLPVAAHARVRQQKTEPDASSLAHRSPEKVFPLDTTWVLASLNGRPVPGEAPSFVVSGQLRATGFSGCNSFSMTLYPVKDQKLAAGAVAITRKSCDKAVMASEHAFLVGLHSMPKWDLSMDGTLSLKTLVGTMAFRRGV